MNRNNRGWLVCDRGICLYAEHARVARCIKHGAILSYDWTLTGCATRAEARKRLDSRVLQAEKKT